MSARPTAIEVFYSYAHEDETLRNTLEKHLSILHRQGLIFSWHDRKIAPGTNWAKDINTHLETASLILLLISADFLASDYCYGIEMKRALERHKANEARVIPILLRPVAWKGAPFEHLQALPTDTRPVTSWPNPDEAFADIAKGIRKAIEALSQPPAPVPRATSPSTWNTPYPRNPMFTGREQILQQLTDALKSGQTTALSQPHAISGLGGIGKTQIALEYAYQHQNEYQAVLWSLSDTRESLISGYIAIAEALSLSQKGEQDQALIIQAVKIWLQTHDSWLLILDNADDLALAREFIPPTFGGHILLTTRAQSMGRLAKRIEVDTMDQNAGALFLLRRTSLIAENAPLDAAPPSDIAIAGDISKELDGLPLALDQAGAFIEETQCSLSDYQQRYRTRRAHLLKRRGGINTDHPKPVATTWSLSFEKVEQKSPMAADLLRFCAFLHPDAIPEELITKGANHLGPSFAPVTEDDLVLDEAIATLGAYSLIRRNALEETLSLHRLVQAVLQDTMNSEMRHLWAERTVQVVHNAFPEEDFTTWPQCERYLPHALVCASLAKQEQISSEDAAALFHEAGRYLIERGRSREAQPLLQQALIMRERHLGPEHTATADTTDRLARCLKYQGKYSEAEPMYLRALAIREQQLGPTHPKTALSLNNLALLYKTQGKYEQAEPLLQRALAIREQQLGPTHPNTAQSLNNLALLYHNQGKHEQAEPLLQRALEINEEQLGGHHPDTASSLNNLALLYHNQGKYEQAEPMYLRALTIREQQLGPTHPNTAQSLNNLAGLYNTQGKYEQAEPMYLRALTIREQQLGTTHPDTASSLNNLALLYYVQGMYAQAEPLLKRALEICEQQLGADHPHTQTARDNYATLKRTIEADDTPS
jgi:tetratricopeptide (TPR) repeat protein